MSAPVETIRLGVEVERRPGTTRWQSVVWCPCALHPGGRGLAPWSPLGSAAEGDARPDAGAGGAPTDVARYHAGEADLLLHRADTQVLKDNLESRAPSIFVVFRRGPSPSGWVLHLVTADPSEAHAHADVGADLVEALPMPPAVFCRAAAFVARHHVERPVWKRRRDRPDLDALSPGRPGTAAAPGRRRPPPGPPSGPPSGPETPTRAGSGDG